MFSCLRRSEEPLEIHKDYVRTLLMVARHGDSDARHLFVRQHAAVLGGYSAYLAHLGESDLEAIFQDAVRSRNGVWPKTLMGLRLALPKHLEPHLPDPWQAWRDLESYEPGGLEIDPVCLMFVDPSDTPFVLRTAQQTVYFCCPRCLETWETHGAVDGTAFLLSGLHGNADTPA